MSSYGGRSAKKLSDMCKEEYGYTCHLCLKPILSDDDYSPDHIIPRSKGGDVLSIENVRPSHRSCNTSRQDRSIEEYRASNTDQTRWFLNLS